MKTSGDQRPAFLAALRRWQRGSISRRQFLGSTGLGVATAALGAAMPELALPGGALGASLGRRVRLATWVNYHDPANFEAFSAATGAAVEISICGSDEEMRTRLKSGRTGWDVIEAGDCRIEGYVSERLIQPLALALIPAYQPQNYVDLRHAKPGVLAGRTYAVQKDWGTVGFCVNRATVSEPVTSWKDFWNLARGKLSERVTVSDEPLALVGSALKFYGHSFNSIEEKELAEAELLLLDAKARILGATRNPQPALRSGDAYLAMAGTGDAEQLRREIPSIDYVIGREGGQIWGDYYAVPKSAPNRTGGHALIDFLLTPARNRSEVMAHGFAVADKRVLDLLPPAMLADPIMFPAAELLQPLEFAAAVCLTNPRRAEIIARFFAQGGGR